MNRMTRGAAALLAAGCGLAGCDPQPPVKPKTERIAGAAERGPTSAPDTTPPHAAPHDSNRSNST